MSEYQWVAFRAIDAPVSAANLEFMRKQSSRAEITAWSFENTYHFGDFHGNVHEMLRRGYDFHVHYADFGIHRIAIRLPWGLPDPTAAKPYLQKSGVSFSQDHSGSGGILEVEPFYEPGDIEGLFNLPDLLESLLPLRDEILSGDLRPLYLAHLAVSCDGNHDPEETVEAPVPAGLDELTDAQEAMAEFYGLNKFLLQAAAEDCPPLPDRKKAGPSHTDWLRKQPQAAKDAWLSKLMSEDGESVRSEVLAAFRSNQPPAGWPVVDRKRTIAELLETADRLNRAAKFKAEAKSARERADRLDRMAKDPAKTLSEIDRLIEVRSSHEYGQAAGLLADLREALQGTDEADLPAQHARSLKESFPSRRVLIGALRKHGLLSK